MYLHILYMYICIYICTHAHIQVAEEDVEKLVEESLLEAEAEEAAAEAEVERALKEGAAARET